MVWMLAAVQVNNSSWGMWMQSGYLAFGKVLFALGIFLLFLPSLLGHKNLLSAFFGAHMWVPIAKVSFSLYMCQQWVIERS